MSDVDYAKIAEMITEIQCGLFLKITEDSKIFGGKNRSIKVFDGDSNKLLKEVFSDGRVLKYE